MATVLSGLAAAATKTPHECQLTRLENGKDLVFQAWAEKTSSQVTSVWELLQKQSVGRACVGEQAVAGAHLSSREEDQVAGGIY